MPPPSNGFNNMFSGHRTKKFVQPWFEFFAYRARNLNMSYVLIMRTIARQHRIQHITFAACGGHTHTQSDAEHHNTFARKVAAKVINGRHSTKTAELQLINHTFTICEQVMIISSVWLKCYHSKKRCDTMLVTTATPSNNSQWVVGNKWYTGLLITPVTHHCDNKTAAATH